MKLKQPLKCKESKCDFLIYALTQFKTRFNGRELSRNVQESVEGGLPKSCVDNFLELYRVILGTVATFTKLSTEDFRVI